MNTATRSTIRPGPVLAGRTTLGIGGSCLAEAIVRTQGDLDELGNFVATEKGRPFVLGGGSNLLAADGELDLIILTNANTVFDVTGETTVCVGGGMKLPVLLSKLQKSGCAGLEGLAGIPGTVGGALAMNAGSRGVEIGERVLRVALWTPLGGLTWIAREDIAFGYRSFSPNVPGKWMIWAVELQLDAGNPARIQKTMAENIARKKATQPVSAKTAGCIFKNPQGDAAGRLLDKAGMKGATVGEMEFSGLHANFMVNKGQGTFAQAMELMDRGRQAVADKFGIQLETEVIVLT